MKQSILDWKSGHVVYWDMESIDLNIPLAEKLWELKEDLAQISYPNGLLIDVGWYPEFSTEGAFRVVVISGDRNWETPLMQEVCSSASTLLFALKIAINFVERHN